MLLPFSLRYASRIALKKWTLKNSNKRPGFYAWALKVCDSCVFGYWRNICKVHKKPEIFCDFF